jgi:hypothetical protein
MTKDDILKLAKEAGFGNYAYEAASLFERFAQLVADQTREECARPWLKSDMGKLPQYLVDILGAYGMARTDFAVGSPSHIEAWQKTIVAIKEYALELVLSEREECAKIVQDNALACDDGSLLQVYLASNAAAIRARAT